MTTKQISTLQEILQILKELHQLYIGKDPNKYHKDQEGAIKISYSGFFYNPNYGNMEANEISIYSYLFSENGRMHQYTLFDDALADIKQWKKDYIKYLEEIK